LKRLFTLVALAGVFAAASAQTPNPFAKPGPAPAVVSASTPAMPLLPKPEPEPPADEEIPATRLGRVGGEYVYRGSVTQTYVFSSATPKVRRVAVTPEMAATKAEQGALMPESAKPALPSMVGDSTPAKAAAASRNTKRPPTPPATPPAKPAASSGLNATPPIPPSTAKPAK